MRKAIVTTAAAAILLGVAITPVTAALADGGARAAQDRAGAQWPAAGHDQIVLRRAGELAVPFEPLIGAGNGLSATRSGFHWGDALIGAGGACALMLLAAGAFVVVRRHRPTGRLAQRAT